MLDYVIKTKESHQLTCVYMYLLVSINNKDLYLLISLKISSDLDNLSQILNFKRLGRDSIESIVLIKEIPKSNIMISYVIFLFNLDS